MNHARSIAAAQTIPVRGDVGANVARHLRLVEVAAHEQARVIVFPELSLTGYELDLADALAFSEQDPRLSPLAASAARHRTTLIVGAPVRVGSRLHIGAFIVSPDGTIALYTKHHLGAFPAGVNPGGSVPPAEATVFHPGDLDPIVPLGDGAAAVAVCADVGRPSHPRAAAERGATTYLPSMFVIPADFEVETAALRAYAVEHSMAVAFSNYGGPSGGLPSAGGSAIWSEKGERLVQLEGTGAGVAVGSESDTGWRAKAVMIGGF